MIIISQQQMDALGQKSQTHFETRMIEHLRHTFPQQAIRHDDTVLRYFVRASIEMCRTFAIVTEFDVQRFIEYVAIYGRDFPRRADMPWVAKILNDQELTGRLKMDQIDEHDALLMHR